MTEYDLYQPLPVGTTINNGATVIASTRRNEYTPGDQYASWVVICVRPGNNFHDYVVWTVALRPDGFHTEAGEYRHSIIEAIGAYTDRGGRAS